MSIGVALEQFSPVVSVELRTGVAGFIGFARQAAGVTPPTKPEVRAYASWHDFAYDFRVGDSWRAGTWLPDEFLWWGVQGFFRNGGQRCFVAFYDPTVGDRLSALSDACQALAEYDEIDLLCSPSLVGLPDPHSLVRHLITTSEQVRREQFIDWFLILDGPAPDAGAQSLEGWVGSLRAAADRPADAALYYPWLVLSAELDPPPESRHARVPPSGHVAGIFARTDRQFGVHRAPANQQVFGVVDLAGSASETAQVNELRALPGRGIRVWGARTLATSGAPSDPNTWINSRRLVLTLERWLVRALAWTVFEANDFKLWVRIHRELEAKLVDLFLRGAFAGKSPAEAFRIKCDEENNPADTRARGRLQVDVQIAPAVPLEFVAIRLIRNADGLTVERGQE